MSELLLTQHTRAIAECPAAITGQELEAMHPLTSLGIATVTQSRREVADIIQGRGSRMLATVAMCCPDESRQPDGRYSSIIMAERLLEIAERPEIQPHLKVVMRYSTGKPRTAKGHRGLDQTNPVLAHATMTDINNMGLPVASEVMTAAQLARISERIAHGWIGARDVSSTALRQLITAYPDIPFLIKNGESGSLESAVNAIETIGSSHKDVEVVRPDGRVGIVRHTPGNTDAALLFRGGKDYPDPETYEAGLQAVAALGYEYGVDTSHGGATAHGGKSAEGQIATLNHVLRMMAGRALVRNPRIVMIEAYLLAGKDASGATPGKSTMDACVNVHQLGDMLTRLAEVHATLQKNRKR